MSLLYLGLDALRQRIIVGRYEGPDETAVYRSKRSSLPNVGIADLVVIQSATPGKQLVLECVEMTDAMLKFEKADPAGIHMPTDPPTLTTSAR